MTLYTKMLPQLTHPMMFNTFLLFKQSGKGLKRSFMIHSFHELARLLERVVAVGEKIFRYLPTILQPQLECLSILTSLQVTTYQILASAQMPIYSTNDSGTHLGYSSFSSGSYLLCSVLSQGTTLPSVRNQQLLYCLVTLL